MDYRSIYCIGREGKPHAETPCVPSKSTSQTATLSASQETLYVTEHWLFPRVHSTTKPPRNRACQAASTLCNYNTEMTDCCPPALHGCNATIPQVMVFTSVSHLSLNLYTTNRRWRVQRNSRCLHCYQSTAQEPGHHH